MLVRHIPMKAPRFVDSITSCSTHQAPSRFPSLVPATSLIWNFTGLGLDEASKSLIVAEFNKCHISRMANDHGNDSQGINMWSKWLFERKLSAVWHREKMSAAHIALGLWG